MLVKSKNYIGYNFLLPNNYYYVYDTHFILTSYIYIIDNDNELIDVISTNFAIIDKN